MKTTIPWIALAWILLGLCGCPTDAADDDDATDEQGTLLGIGLSPNDPRMAPGETIQITAKAFYDDYTNADVTEDVTWISSDERVAVVSDDPGSKGECVALEAGETEIVATHDGGVSARVTVTVSGAEIVSVEVTPSQVELHPGDEVELKAIATYADGTSGNIAGSCAWEVDDASVAVLDAPGQLRAVAEGQTLVHVTYEDFPIPDVAVEVVAEDQPLPEPDLRIVSFDGVAVDDDILYEVTIENEGDGYADGFYLQLYLDLPGAPDLGDDFDDLDWFSGLAGGDSEDVAFTLYDVAPGTYDSWIWIDPDGWVDETDEGNNVAGPATVTVESDPLLADLGIYTFDGLTDGQYTMYTIEVINWGDAPSGAFWLDLFHDQIDEPAVGDYGDDYVNVPSLDPYESFLWEPDVADGPAIVWDSWVLADSLDSVVEVDETDNVGYLELWP